MSRPSAAALENLNAAPLDIPALALSNHVYGDLMPRNFPPAGAPQELPQSLDFSPSIYPSDAIDSLPAATPEQLRPIFDKATSVSFTSAADNQKSGQQPDFFLGADGKLRANPDKKNPNKDGSINIELQAKNKSDVDAKKFADQMQKAAIKDLINYFAKNNPGAKIPQDWLDQLQKEPDLPPAPVPLAIEPPSVPDVPAPAPQDQPAQPVQQTTDSSCPSAGGGGGGGGGGSYGGDGGGGGGGRSYGGDSGVSRAGSDGVGPDVNLNANSPAALQIMDYFVEKGLTKEQAAGITGNLQYESGLNPAITEAGNGIGYGLAQWSFGRRDALNEFAQSEGKPVSDMKVQLDFLWKEMNTTEPAALEAFKANPNMSAAEASNIFYDKFERPLFNPENRNNRAEAATQFLAQYESNNGSQGAVADNSGPSGNAPAPTEFNQRLVAAIKEQDASMAGTGYCAKAVQQALNQCGLPEFLGSGNGGEMDKPLLASGKFKEISYADAKPGDIIVRPPSANPNDDSVYGDISVITARNGDNITQTNDATYQFHKDNDRYDGKAKFLRYTG